MYFPYGAKGLFYIRLMRSERCVRSEKCVVPFRLGNARGFSFDDRKINVFALWEN